MTYRIVVFKSEQNGQYYFNIVGGNSKIVAQSEGYLKRSSCNKMARKLANSLITFDEIL